LASTPLGRSERLVLLAARAIARRIREARHRSLLAGIGQSFAAARLALMLLSDDAREVELAVETGIFGFDPRAAHPFLLSADNMALAKRLGSVDDGLGELACGAQNRCLAVIGCAEADERGNVNSSRARGTLLVGSGGASDLGSNAREVLVLCKSDRLVERVEFVTSPGRGVLTIVTDAGVLERRSTKEPWGLSCTGLGPESVEQVLASIPFAVRPLDAPAPPATEVERSLLATVLEHRSSSVLDTTSRAHA
jgi:hypothetical protein